VNATGVYGSQGTAAAANVPGARAGAAAWKDSAGNLWLFGGYWQNANGSSFSFYNDVWKYSPASGEWTWVGGSNTPGALGVFGTQGVAAQANVPGARSTPAVWTDGNGNAWLFAGEGPDSTGATVRMNDLWKYPTQ
jgi:N-acetylneuraminic acid mutarotase